MLVCLACVSCASLCMSVCLFARLSVAVGAYWCLCVGRLVGLVVCLLVVFDCCVGCRCVFFCWSCGCCFVACSSCVACLLVGCVRDVFGVCLLCLCVCLFVCCLRV